MIKTENGQIHVNYKIYFLNKNSLIFNNPTKSF